MENFNKIWRAFFAIQLIAIAAQQLFCADFRPVILPPGYPHWLADRVAWTWICSIIMIVANVAILFEYRGRVISLIMADTFLLMILLFHIPYHLSTDGSSGIGAWNDAFKTLVFCGGSYIVAGTFDRETTASGIIRFSGKLIPAGKYFFCATMIVFGAEHLLYEKFVAPLVPGWIPWPDFWTYFAGAALIAGGIGIVIDVKRRLAAFLLGVAIFTWFIVLHIPRAIADPHSGHGNEWSSVFESFGFSGIAFILSGRQAKSFMGSRNK